MLLFTIALVTTLLLNIYLIFKIIALIQDKRTAILFFVSLVVALVVATKIIDAWNTNREIRRFESVSVLKEFSGFYTDEWGISKVDSITSRVIADNIVSRDESVICEGENSADSIDNITSEVSRLKEDYRKILDGEIQNELSRCYFSIQQKPDSIRTEWEKAVTNYMRQPINEDGFRSIAFKKYNHKKPSILLLGDSFTWGHSADNAGNSFADILLGMGYVVYNTGITGSDVAQYLAIAEKYIPELQPDFVIANFYLGNDISYYKREVLPFKPFFYHTNAGFLLACPHGIYLSKEEAYHLTQAYYLPFVNDDNIVGKCLLKTVLGPSIIKMLDKSPFTPYLTSKGDSVVEAYYTKIAKRKYSMPYSNQELNGIKKRAEQYNARFVLSVIPWIDRFANKRTRDFPDLFEGLDYIEMQADESDYNMRDGHYNNQGHSRYAHFLKEFIEHNNKK